MTAMTPTRPYATDSRSSAAKPLVVAGGEPLRRRRRGATQMHRCGPREWVVRSIVVMGNSSFQTAVTVRVRPPGGSDSGPFYLRHYPQQSLRAEITERLKEKSWTFDSLRSHFESKRLL